MTECNRPTLCHHGVKGHCCKCLDCDRFEREDDWCVRCGEQQKGIGRNNVCSNCENDLRLSGRMRVPKAWDGQDVDTFAYQLAGALSRVMLPDNQEMPSMEITATIEHLLERGPL